MAQPTAMTPLQVKMTQVIETLLTVFIQSAPPLERMMYEPMIGMMKPKAMQSVRGMTDAQILEFLAQIKGAIESVSDIGHPDPEQ